MYIRQGIKEEFKTEKDLLKLSDLYIFALTWALFPFGKGKLRHNIYYRINLQMKQFF